MISIVMCCYNAGRFLSPAIASVLQQDHEELELIFVNDGSTDDSLSTAQTFAAGDSRITILSKINGGLNAARNFGARYVSSQSDAILFFDADDLMHKSMISRLYKELLKESNIGAVFCDYECIDEEGVLIDKGQTSKRIIPVRKWFKELNCNVQLTPFFSIYAWAPMGEAFTMIKKELFFLSGGWDEMNFPIGHTYGESIPLFGEISLNHKVIFLNDKLYFYRKHRQQITSSNFDKAHIQKKIDSIMSSKKSLDPESRIQVRKTIQIVRFRLPLYNYLNGLVKHELRYSPLTAVKNLLVYFGKYLYSLRF